MAAAERLTDFTPTDGGKNKGQPQHKEQSPEPSKAKSEGASKSFSSRKDSSHSIFYSGLVPLSPNSFPIPSIDPVVFTEAGKSDR